MITRSLALAAITAAIVAVSGPMTACKNSDDPAQESESPVGTKPDTTATTSDTTTVTDTDTDTDTDTLTTGTLAIVDFSVQPVAAQGAFLATQSAANAAGATTPGSLAIAVEGAGLADPEPVYRTPTVPASSIASGAPDAMTVYVKRIVLTTAENGGPDDQAILFESEAGAPLRLGDGGVDLSGLAAEATDGKVRLTAKPGTYSMMRVTFARRGQVTGCVRMLYTCGDNPENLTCSANPPTADIPGMQSVPDPAAGSLRTYCTRAAGAAYAETPAQNSTFEDQPPEAMDFDLGMPNADWPADTDETTTYPFPAPVTLAVGEEALRLTLVVDLNRMLRYYNRGRTQGVNPGAPTDRAFFFTTVFAESTFAFLGAPGRIYGYEMVARTCREDDSWNDIYYSVGTGKCGNGTDPSHLVPFWMTLITTPTGAPVKALFMPDDDNALTITKGSVSDFARCPDDGDPAWLRLAEDGLTASIHYALCDNEGDGTEPGPSGKLVGFPVDLEATTPLAPETAAGAGNIPGVIIRSNQRRTPADGDSLYEGPVDITRRL